jgi:hypothetical protein
MLPKGDTPLFAIYDKPEDIKMRLIFVYNGFLYAIYGTHLLHKSQN